MAQLVAAYEHLSQPCVLLRPEEVEGFLEGADMSELQAFVDACVSTECFEYAVIANQLMNLRTSASNQFNST